MKKPKIIFGKLIFYFELYFLFQENLLFFIPREPSRDKKNIQIFCLIRLLVPGLLTREPKFGGISEIERQYSLGLFAKYFRYRIGMAVSGT